MSNMTLREYARHPVNIPMTRKELFSCSPREFFWVFLYARDTWTYLYSGKHWNDAYKGGYQNASTI